MDNLEQARALAQREADKKHRTMLVLDLSPSFSPLYVVRDWSQEARDGRGFVCEVEPAMYV